MLGDVEAGIRKCLGSGVDVVVEALTFASASIEARKYYFTLCLML